MQGNDEASRIADADAAKALDPDRGSAKADNPHDPAKGDAARPAKTGDLQAYIGRQLRAVYDDVARQPIPDRFLELMKKLETAS